MSAPVNVISQLKPAAATLSDLYTPGAGRRGRITLTAASQVATEDIRVSLAQSAAANTAAQYLAWDVTVSQDVPFQLEAYLKDADVLRVYSAGGNVSFTANGYEDDIPSA